MYECILNSFLCDFTFFHFPGLRMSLICYKSTLTDGVLDFTRHLTISRLSCTGCTCFFILSAVQHWCSVVKGRAPLSGSTVCFGTQSGSICCGEKQTSLRATTLMDQYHFAKTKSPSAAEWAAATRLIIQRKSMMNLLPEWHSLALHA